MNVDSANYDYVMYVDASGDDGFKFEKDSTPCYAAAALLVKREDIEHNLKILGEIKKIVGCKDTDEVKYSKIRRHRHGHEAMQLLKGIKGKLSCHVVFKKELLADEYAGNKKLSVVCHAMSLTSLEVYQLPAETKVLIAIDRMKHSEEKPLEELLCEEDDGALKLNYSREVIFRDSKDRNFLLIQIADLMCGTVREHFEQYETQADMLYFKNLCPSCFYLHQNRRSSHQPLCKNGKSRTAKIISSANFKNILPLFPESNSIDMIDYIFMDPVKMVKQHMYMLCQKKK